MKAEKIQSQYFLNAGDSRQGAIITTPGSLHAVVSSEPTNCQLAHFVNGHWRGDFKDAFCAHIFFEN